MTKLSLAIALTVCALPCALAQSRFDDSSFSPSRLQQPDDSRNRLPEAVNRIERETGGRVLSAERRTRGGREVSRIKVFTPEGRVRIMWDDPARDRAERPDRVERVERAERSEFGDRGVRSRRPQPLPQSRPQPDLSAVVQGERPEQTPLPERVDRRDDGSPGF